MDGQNFENENVAFTLQRVHHMALIQVACLIVYWNILRRRVSKNKLTRDMMEEREQVRQEIMSKLIGSNKCRSIIRMGAKAFIDLCDILVKKGGLRPTRHASVEEQVAKSLYILGHTVKNVEISFFFRRSGETVSRHLRNVLTSLIVIENTFLKQPDGSEIPPQILNNDRFYPFFKVKKFITFFLFIYCIH